MFIRAGPAALYAGSPGRAAAAGRQVVGRLRYKVDVLGSQGGDLVFVALLEADETIFSFSNARMTSSSFA